MTSPELIALCLIVHASCWLALVLVRLDQRRKERRYQDKLDAAKARLRGP